MSEQEKKEQKILNQEMDPEEMENVAAGIDDSSDDSDDVLFPKIIKRNFYNEDGSINCAATVEDGSWCKSNDACYTNQMDYQGMKSCSKAWK